MVERTNEINNHALIKEIEESIELLERLLELEESMEEEHLTMLYRIQHVLVHLSIIYKNTDPLMINPNKLTTFYNKNIANKSTYRLSKLLHHLNLYENDKDIHHLKAVNTIIDGAISIFSYFIYPKTGKETVGLRSASEKYHKVLLNYVSTVQNELYKFNQSYKQMSASIETEIKNKDNEIEEFKLDLQDQQDNVMEKYSENLEKKINDFNKTISKYISEVEGIVGALAERSISYGFKQIANEEKQSKEKWNKYTVWSFIFLIIYTISMVVVSFFQEFTFGSIILRGLTGVGAFGALIGFCSKQANMHAKAERHNRNKELELASMNPFFAEYDKTELFEVKKELANRYFGADDKVTKDRSGSIYIKDFETIIENINKFKST